MASAKKRTREELIEGGYCTVCSKCMGQLPDEEGVGGCYLYVCHRCKTLQLELASFHGGNPALARPDVPYRFEVTEHYEAIRDWYNNRREQVESQISELQIQLLKEVPDAITAIAARSKQDSTKGLTLVKG